MKDIEESDLKFSVLMSVYKKEQPVYLKECLDSLVNQTIQPNELVLIEDGPLTNDLYTVLDEFENQHPGLLNRNPLEENVGLGKALAIGVEYCRYSLIARMDTDDIAVNTRFEKQLREFVKNPKLGIVGSDINEFETDISNIVAKRIVPHSYEDILKTAKRRNPFNHMTVLYRKEEVLRAGNYMVLNGFEDYYLWVRMLKNDTLAKNVPEVLVHARAGRDMFMRRGGYKYLKDSKLARKKIHEVGLNSYMDYFLSTAGQIIVSIMPNQLRAYIYTKLLRKESK
ncbi:glycosyltransferase [Carnobacterium antarcticum]|uniref:Glycosyltransferase n=1 Tax=Carnobacterium antarcticum TaxID=2126436 RepID=A0ABW4NNX0_9LACT|nr:glycosyltransferase [Carnobacterium sp. CP1]ALV21563.1 glycosyltransferase [Carnobacterium sp. CP1]